MLLLLKRPAHLAPEYILTHETIIILGNYFPLHNSVPTYMLQKQTLRFLN